MTRKHTLLKSWLLIACLAIFSADLRGEVGAILVSGNAQSAPVVQIIADAADLTKTENALLFFPVQGSLAERWVPLPNEKSLAELRNESHHTVGSSRGFGGTIADAISAQTVQLEQLQAFVANRSVPQYTTTTIFSPADGSTLLNPRPTFRRLPVTDAQTKMSRYPAVTARVFRANQQVLEMTFAEGRNSMSWATIPNAPEGLTPENYTIRVDGSDQTVSFTTRTPKSRGCESASSEFCAFFMGFPVFSVRQFWHVPAREHHRLR